MAVKQHHTKRGLHKSYPHSFPVRSSLIPNSKSVSAIFRSIDTQNPSMAQCPMALHQIMEHWNLFVTEREGVFLMMVIIRTTTTYPEKFKPWAILASRAYPESGSADHRGTRTKGLSDASFSICS